MKRLLRQMFCKHDWILHADYGATFSMMGRKSQWFDLCECVKCEKIAYVKRPIPQVDSGVEPKVEGEIGG